MLKQDLVQNGAKKVPEVVETMQKSSKQVPTPPKGKSLKDDEPNTIGRSSSVAEWRTALLDNLADVLGTCTRCGSLGSLGASMDSIMTFRFCAQQASYLAQMPHFGCSGTAF